MDTFAYLAQMSEKLGPSGHEVETSAWYRELFTPLCDEVKVDALFNVIAYKKHTAPLPEGVTAPRVMLCAHQDEIGLLVTDILPDGTLRLGSIGGVDPRILPGSRVTVYPTGDRGKKLPAIVGYRPAQMQTEDERSRNYQRDELWADTGLSLEEVKAMVHIGDLVALYGPATKLLNDYAASKTMDDRACIGCLLQAAERLQTLQCKCDVYFVCTTQEEIGSKGAAVSAWGIHPDLAIALDVSHATIPASRADTTVPVDAPALTCGPYIQHKLLARALRVAKEHGIAVNTELSPMYTSTDADDVILCREGIPCLLIDLPLKYMHTTVETLSMQALRECGRLLAEFLHDLDEGWADDLWME